ncbi:MAG TPA: DUF2752 domain-containing protein [Bryobacteraceae bacterium]|jgi:hypothetical protein|nr:DUF2752 domain-containing protein [Bryobacteraceae bacterium]
MAEDVRRSFRIVWVTISLMVLAVLVSPFALGRERLARIVPACEWKAKYGKECSLCGMTTSFLDISEGRLGEASHANRGGIPIYLLFVANEICALAFIRRKGAI